MQQESRQIDNGLTRPIEGAVGPLRRLLLAAVILVAAIACVGPFFTVAKWSGHFTLMVNLDADPEVDRASIVYLECWNEEVAKWLVEDSDTPLDGFERPERTTANVHELSISAGGDSGAFGLIDTYHHPEYLIVQYRLNGELPEATSRKAVRIPPGRGDRSVSVSIP